MYKYVTLDLLWIIVTFMKGAGNCWPQNLLVRIFLKYAADCHYYYCDTEKCLHLFSF